MNTSLNEALQILRGWSEKPSGVNAILRTSNAVVSVGGWILDVTDDGVIIGHASESYKFMASLLSAVSLDYSDPDEAPRQVKEWAQKTIRSSMLARFSDGSELILAELVTA